MPPILIDTNLLVYAHDTSNGNKQELAIATLEMLQLNGNGRLSVQCLAEFFSVMTRPLRGALPRLRPGEALAQMERFSRAFPVFNITLQIALEAGRGVTDHQLSYFDAQLWATARLNQIPVVFSEDFASGTYLESVHFINPFAPEFSLEEWIS